MANKSNEQAHSNASVRRTIFLGEFETITVELPIDLDLISDLGLEPAIWKTILDTNSTLLEWAKCVYQSRNFNIGKGALDKLSTEITLIQKHIDILAARSS